VRYFIGIVPPDDYKKRIERFRNRWASNRTGEVAEPHITVKAQGGLTEDLAWLDRVREVCASFPRFQLSLGEPETYGEAVAYLDVRSDEIHELHRRLLNAVSPPPELIRLHYEGELYDPHLTLGQTHWGMSGPEIMEMKREARTALAPWPVFPVAFVRVYKEIEPDKYVPFEDIPLAP
jgi:2'-5' RNA ligase